MQLRPVGLARTLHFSVMQPRKTAGVIVIGDEILKGTTQDTNSNFIARRLHALGVAVKKVSVISDSVEEIGDEVKHFHSKFDFVFTTGGVGPTHDDKTYAGIAQAFELPLSESEEIKEVIRKVLPAGKVENAAAATERLYMIPRGAELLWGAGAGGVRSVFPVVKVQNVISFPGVPRFCQRAFTELQEQLFSASEYQPLFSSTVYTTADEVRFSAQLSELASRHSAVEIGSYPVLNNNFYRTKLVVESEHREKGMSVVEDIRRLLADKVVFYDQKAWKKSPEKFASFRERELNKGHIEYVEHLDDANKILDEILDKYQLNEIALSFNGGKDCTVLLHLLRMKVDLKYGEMVPIQGFHIMCEDPFPEVTQFILEVSQKYNIRMTEYPGPLKSGLEALIKQYPSVKAVVMGSRSSDPKGKYMTDPVQMTDSDWPVLLRVCPILYWTYKDVWTTLRGLCVPYCSLYDQGYTSLGGRENTEKNEQLKMITREGRESYLPAFMLEDGEKERCGRAHM